MGLALSTSLRNAKLDAIRTNLDTGGGGLLRIYSGTRPTTCGTTTTLLVQLALANPSSGASSNGVLTFNAITTAVSAIATGTATWFRLVDAAGTCILDGNVGTSGSDLNLASTSITIGVIVSISAFALTEKNIYSGTPSGSVIFFDDFSLGNLSKQLNGSNFWTDNSSSAIQPSGTGLSTITVQPDVTGPATGYSVVAHYAGTTNNLEGARPELRFSFNGGQYSEIWISYDIFIPSNYFHRTNPYPNNKFLIVANDPVSSLFIDCETFPDSNYGSGADVGSVQLKYDGVNHGFYNGANSTWVIGAPVDRGLWHHYVYHYKLATSASANDGIVQVWKNGNIQRNFIDWPNYSPGSNYISMGYIFGAANSGFAVNTDLKMTNFTLSTAPLT